MGNSSSTSRRNVHRHRNHSLQNLTRTAFTSLRRMMQIRVVHTGSPRERNEDFEAFERLLRDDFSINNMSESDIAQHLVTMHVSYIENERECTIYISVYNNGHEKVVEGTINQDLTRDAESECFMTITQPQTERTSNLRFISPFSATTIKSFLEQFSSLP